MNFMVLIFSFLTTTIIILGSLINVIENKLPPFFIKIFKYGKFAYEGEVSKIASKFVVEVPKSWFKHFYLLALLIYAYIFYLVTYCYIYKYDAPGWFINFLRVICGENRIPYTSATKTYIAVVLMTLQVIRRFYDTHFVSVFGKNSRMNLSQYLIGLVHYPACALAIVCEAPKFTTESLSTTSTTFDIASITYVNIFAILLFIWAWWHQHTTTKILANLRRNKKSNQIETILLSHWWYQKTFDKFPKNRKALIPFMY
ncbi:hypothetical protein NQ314_008126 [Rhamnusium bicolor]|uniref:Polyprenal reductase n=1 Tax=Rhamnusium bicolor TaxID=1586634 RepID=A0AAV8YDE1_9CUCU|nr:hypothetical protein NQ314_008126 [Rhamnusium bicolor]